MLTERQEHAYKVLPVAVANYHSACQLLNQNLTPAQRLSRQQVVRIRLNALNLVREAAGLPQLAGPHLLSVDELLQPAGLATPADLQAALAATEFRPGLFAVVAQYGGTNAVAA